MRRKGFFVIIILTMTLLLLAACDNDAKQVKNSSVGFITDNDITVNILTSYMKPLNAAKRDTGIINSLKAKITNDSIDFSSITYSDDTVNKGDVVYVEGVIPEKDYPIDKVYAYSEPEEKVSFENAILTNKDGDTVLTFDVVGEEVGIATVYVGIDDSEYVHKFDLEITEASSRSIPNSYTVYCTPTGGKYHSYGCGYLRGNGIAISLEDALARGLGPCSRCQP